MVAKRIDSFNKNSGAKALAKQFLTSARKVVREAKDNESEGILRYSSITERTLEVLLVTNLPKSLLKRGVVANQVRDKDRDVADIVVRSSHSVKGGLVIELKRTDAANLEKGVTQLRRYMQQPPRYAYGMLLVFPKETPDASKIRVLYFQNV